MFEKLRELAEKATPGPWEFEHCENPCGVRYQHVWSPEHGDSICSTYHYDAIEVPSTLGNAFAKIGKPVVTRTQPPVHGNEANAAYIAAVDPQTALGLLESIEAWQAGNTRHMREAERMAAQVVALRESLRDIRKLASAHHADQPSHVLLHALTVDIPDMVEKAFDEGPQSGCKPTRFDPTQQPASDERLSAEPW